MKSFKDIFISTEARAFMDTFGMSGHIRGDKRLPYCQQLRDREDKQIGYLLRNISESEAIQSAFNLLDDTGQSCECYAAHTYKTEDEINSIMTSLGFVRDERLKECSWC